jgi:hypothetical protein
VKLYSASTDRFGSYTIPCTGRWAINGYVVDLKENDFLEFDENGKWIKLNNVERENGNRSEISGLPEGVPGRESEGV